MGRTSIALTLALCLVFVVGCPPPDDNEGMGEGSGEGAGEGMGEAPQMFELVLRLESLEPEGGYKEIWFAIDDREYTRETFPYEAVPLQKQGIATRYAINFQMDEESIMVEAGKYVTIVAFDGNESFFEGVSQFTDVDDVVYPNANEFCEFAGITIDEGLDKFGEVSFRMVRSRVITAVYQQKPTVIIEATVNGEPNAFPSVDISGRISEYLTFPGMGGEDTFNFVASGGSRGFQILGALHTGSSLTVTPRGEQSNPNLVFINFSGSCDGGGCEVTAAEDLRVTSNWALP